MKKFWIQTLGCKANFSDGQQIEAGLRRKGFLPAQNLEEADVVVVNSCTVTNEADLQSRKAVTTAAKKNPHAKIVYTGCGAEVSPEIAAQTPGLTFVVGNQNKDELPELLVRQIENESENLESNTRQNAKAQILGGVANYSELKSRHPEDRDWNEPDLNAENILNLERGEGTFRTRSFLRIQEGCNHFCTYCVIPYGRGPSRSVSKNQILKTAQELVEADVQEIVLTGTNIGDTEDFEAIVHALLSDVKVPRLRLSSLDPVEISPALVQMMSEHPNLCPHFHVSLQSPHGKILKWMKRKYTDADVHNTLQQISKIPRENVFVGMDVITGFPGEDELIFQETVDALKNLPWTRLHVFPYSERAGTPATRLPNSVLPQVRKERARVLNQMSLNRMIEVYSDIRRRADDFVVLRSVLFENIFRPKGQNQAFLSGYSLNYQRVWVPIADGFSPELVLNKTFDVKAKTWAVDRVANEVYWIAESFGEFAN